MSLRLTGSDIDIIRGLLKAKVATSDKEVSTAIGRDYPGIKTKITKFRTQLLDDTISSEALAETLSTTISKKTTIVPPKLEIQHDQSMSGLPPKMRAKVPMSKTPTESVAPFDCDPIPLNSGRSLSCEHIKANQIPLLPKILDNPISPSRAHQNNPDPEIGSLAVVFHKLLGPAHICRVLSSKLQNGEKHYLVAFFQKGLDPCYVLGDYLFQLHSHVGFPLSDEKEWIDSLGNEEISVDWILEHIYSGAQSLVITHAELLFPAQALAKSAVKPDPQLIQQILFQGVSFAALLLLCYVVGKWSIPPNKIKIILATIMKTNPAKFASTQNILDQINASLETLLSLQNK